MSVSAAQVKELRERTGLGMMECKSALLETKGDMEAAADLLRKKAGAKVEKKSGRIAAEGMIAIHEDAAHKVAAIAEVNCETDFVAKSEDFLAFGVLVAAGAAKHNPHDVTALYELPLRNGDSQTIGRARENLVGKLGENIHVRRFVRFETKSHLGTYIHGRRIGVVAELHGGDHDLAHDIAMHIAASRPEFLNKEDVPAAAIAKEREIFTAQAATSGKPADIIDKMVAGRINKYLNEVTLLGQPFVKDPDTTMAKLLQTRDARVVRFLRYEVGEGIERRSGDFAAEVMAQVKGG